MQTNTTTIAELSSKNLGSRIIARENSTADGEAIVKIALNKIVVRDGFNVRQDFGDIQSLAYSILENGQVQAGRVDILQDGTFLLVDGHRRYKACVLLAEMGNEPFFRAVVNSSKTTEEQRILQMFTTQDNKPLQPGEVAELINRLINLGHTQATISKKIGKTPAYVSQMLSYANESLHIKEHVNAGEISVSAVLQLQKDIPVQSQRIAAVKKAVAAKKETIKESDKPDAKVNVSVKDVTGKPANTGKEIENIKAALLKWESCTDVEQFNIGYMTAVQEMLNLLSKY